MTSFPGEGTAELVIIDAPAHRLELFKRLPRARSATFAPACASAPGGNSAQIETEKRKTPLITRIDSCLAAEFRSTPALHFQKTFAS
jgi:hypothetical protein